MVGNSAPSIITLPSPKSGCRSYVIRVDQIHPFIPQLFPYPISQTNRPSRLIPIPHLNSLLVRYRHLRSQERQLRLVERSGRPMQRAELDCKIRGRNGRDKRSNITECAVQRRYRGIPEIIALGDRLDQGERSISRSDYGNGAIGYRCATCVLYPREIACTT